MPFRVTAAIPAFNAQHFIADALRSVLAQSYGCFECLVINDGSTDETEAVVRSFDGVRHIWQPNEGVAAARNRAIAEASGDLIAFLDADDIWLPIKIEKQVAKFREIADLALVYTGLLVVNRKLVPLEELHPAPGEVALRNTLLVERPYMTGIGSTGLVRTSIARSVGFDERLSTSADWDFGCAIAARHRVDSIDQPLVLYRQHGMEQMHRDLELVERDMCLMWEKRFNGGDIDLGVRAPRRRARANLCLSLAAGYLHRGNRFRFARHFLEAIGLRPDRVVAALWRHFGPGGARQNQVSTDRGHSVVASLPKASLAGDSGEDHATSIGTDARVLRRRGKEARERFAAGLLLVLVLPVFACCAVAIRLEALVNPKARGPVFFKERRISRGREIELLKFRTLTASAISSLPPGPTHIAVLERRGELTMVGRVLKQWYLDELPQLWNIVRGDMFLIGTRPYPLELYEDELSRGITRKRDMPAGLVGPVQAAKGAEGANDLDLDLEYWDRFQKASAVSLLLLDISILWRSLRVQLQHKGI